MLTNICCVVLAICCIGLSFTVSFLMQDVNEMRRELDDLKGRNR